MKIKKYIYKYNTRSSPKYVFDTVLIKYQSLQEMYEGTSQFINHVLHPTTGTSCSYRKLATDTVPDQSA